MWLFDVCCVLRAACLVFDVWCLVCGVWCLVCGAWCVWCVGALAIGVCCCGGWSLVVGVLVVWCVVCGVWWLFSFCLKSVVFALFEALVADGCCSLFVVGCLLFGCC